MKSYKDFPKYKKLEKPVTMKVHTKTPSKWTLIDNETGQIYQGSEKLANTPGHNGWELFEDYYKKLRSERSKQ
jgi:hypothetical protein